MMAPVTDQTFETEVLQADVPVLVDFWAEWCAPCKVLDPVLNDLSSEMAGQVKIVSMDSAANLDTVTRYNVRSMPTFLLFKDGEPVDMRVGAAQSRAGFIKWIEEFTA